MRHGSLFSGIGGFDLAAQWMGWENVFQVEWDSYCQKVLAKNFPNVKRYGDIKEFDGTEYRGLIDIISGGFPCQPYSLAGKRKGKADDRHLWPEMLRIIGEVQPGWVVGENVPGIINWSAGLVFEEVQADLEAKGYKVFSVILPAVGRGSVHRRRRIWFIAYSSSNAITGQNRQSYTIEGTRFTSNDKGIRKQLQTVQYEGLDDLLRDTSDSGLQRQAFSKKQTTGIEQCSKRNNANSIGQRLQRKSNGRKFKSIREGEEQQFTRPLFTTWEDFPTQSPICGGNDGIPNRVDRLKGLRNAIVPQVAFQIFKVIEQYNNLNLKL